MTLADELRTAEKKRKAANERHARKRQSERQEYVDQVSEDLAATLILKLPDLIRKRAKHNTYYAVEIRDPENRTSYLDLTMNDVEKAVRYKIAEWARQEGFEVKYTEAENSEGWSAKEGLILSWD